MNNHQLVDDRGAVLASYEEAIRAISVSGREVRRWDAPTPCGEWTALDLVGHMLAIVRYYHRLLDAAIAGRPLSDLPRGAQLAAMNADDLARLPESTGAERVELYVELAGDHLRRLREVDWDLVLGTWSGLGELSVGQHTGVAIGEWHVHEWDLARALGSDHRPSDPLTIARGQRTVLRAIGPGDPWVSVLHGYGRDPG